MQKNVNAIINDDFHLRAQYGSEMAGYRNSGAAAIVFMIFRQVVR